MKCKSNRKRCYWLGQATANSESAIALGTDTSATANSATYWPSAAASESSAVAIGNAANAGKSDAIAVGRCAGI